VGLLSGDRGTVPIVTALAEDLREVAQKETLLREARRRMAKEHPAYLGHFVHAIDAKTGEEFDFDLLDEEEAASIKVEPRGTGWYWHRELLDDWLANVLSLELKARQIGITWLAALLALWYALFRPGVRVLIVSVNEDEAKKVIARIWGMWKSLPDYLGVDIATVSKPVRGGDPSQEIEWTHRETGKKSTILALAQSSKAGHGETAALVILDEFSRQEYAREIWKGVFPVIDGGGRIVVISTANGVSNEQTGEGNFFHYLWVNALSMNIVRRFLGWFRHPKRDEEWYRTKASSLPPADRAEQYPRTPEDAFINTGQCWFDLEKLNAYQARWREKGMKPLYRLRFDEVESTPPKARKTKTAQGEWRIYEEPDPKRSYAIAADVASGTGNDFSSAHVIDLTTGAWVAEYHARVPEDVFAKDLYYGGRMYLDALIAVENQGGYGTAVIIQLRDGVKGRKAYANLYRHRVTTDQSTRQRERQDFGFPMNSHTRPLVINLLEQGIREETIPWISPELDGELRTFSVAKSLPSPRAQDGTNDDRVMSAAISRELFRQFGTHKKKRKSKSKSRWRETLYPWES
jgi:hypothetical protein